MGVGVGQYLDSIFKPDTRAQVTGEGTGEDSGLSLLYIYVSQALGEVTHGTWGDTEGVWGAGHPQTFPNAQAPRPWSTLCQLGSASASKAKASISSQQDVG